ncbi:MAG TPA: argininosuccinate lyase [Candidatus Thermoplasmatota archaeon]|nr:argininosuccinate lyase [Candidatus Thermoplasmatota archaeon]
MSTRRVWEARTGAIHPDFLAYSESIADDAPFLVHDLAGSVAHVLGLRKSSLLTDAEATALVAGLQNLWRAAEAGSWNLDPALEDIHMNIEARLTSELGDTGRKLHTGRSRNDQVATCMTLYARLALAGLAQAAHTLSEALAAQAKLHAKTPWASRTHGQPAQPATLGFLLLAHAFRFQDAAEEALHAFHAVGESPLGSGAVAGSTLPLDPAFTARLLGLRPPRNALLATGTRDTVLAAVQAACRAGHAASGLAQDLLDLFAVKVLRLPDGYTTGSSLMPQKRNPDSLELARAKGKALAGPWAAVWNVTAGLGLGYQRDFQVTKPHLVAALRDATATLELLAPLVQGARFDAEPLSAGLKGPGIVATDAAEALVAAGMPFRAAYAAVAAAYAAVEKGRTLPEALEGQGLPAAALAKALQALTPDPARRRTLGGPAPLRVREALDGHRTFAAKLAGRVADAQAAAERPYDLLTASPSNLLAET